jgi:hypothetical protein
MQTPQQYVSPLFWWFSFYSDFFEFSLILKCLTK